VQPDERRPRTPEQTAEHERHEDRVVELAGDRDEVRHEVEGKRQVDERKCRRHLPARGHARVREQSLEQDRAVRHQPRDHPDVPLPAAHNQHGDHRRVHGDEHEEG